MQMQDISQEQVTSSREHAPKKRREQGSYIVENLKKRKEVRHEFERFLLLKVSLHFSSEKACSKIKSFTYFYYVASHLHSGEPKVEHFRVKFLLFNPV